MTTMWPSIIGKPLQSLRSSKERLRSGDWRRIEWAPCLADMKAAWGIDWSDTFRYSSRIFAFFVRFKHFSCVFYVQGWSDRIKKLDACRKELNQNLDTVSEKLVGITAEISRSTEKIHNREKYISVNHRDKVEVKKYRGKKSVDGLIQRSIDRLID